VRVQARIVKVSVDVADGAGAGGAGGVDATGVVGFSPKSIFSTTSPPESTGFGAADAEAAAAARADADVAADVDADADAAAGPRFLGAGFGAALATHA
jgi:hypothetical protein